MSSSMDPSFGTNPYQSPLIGGREVTPQFSDRKSEVSDRTIEMLRQTKPWVRFMSVLGFLTSGFMLIAALAVGLGRGPAQAGVAVVYLLFAVLYTVGSVHLFRYASRIADLMGSRDVLDLESALESQKAFWRLLGITVAIVMVLYAIIIVVGLIMFATSRSV